MGVSADEDGIVRGYGIDEFLPEHRRIPDIRHPTAQDHPPRLRPRPHAFPRCQRAPDHLLHSLHGSPLTDSGPDVRHLWIEFSLSVPDVHMGIVQTGDDGLALQVEDQGAWPDVGPHSGIIAHVDELAVLHRKGGGRAEGFIDGIDGPIDVCPISFLGVTNPNRNQEGRQEQKKNERDSGTSFPNTHRIRSFFDPPSMPPWREEPDRPFEIVRVRGKMGFSGRTGQGMEPECVAGVALK